MTSPTSKASRLQLIQKLRRLTQAGISDCKRTLEATNFNLPAAVKKLQEASKSGLTKKTSVLTNEGIAKIFPYRNRLHGFVLTCETDFACRNQAFQALGHKIEFYLQTAPVGATPEQVLAQQADGQVLAEIINQTSTILGEKINLDRVLVWDLPAGTGLGFYNHGNHHLSTACLFQKAGDATATEVIAMQIAALKPVFIQRADIPVAQIQAEEKALHDRAATTPSMQTKPKNVVAKIIAGQLNKWISQICLVEQMLITNPKQKVGAFLAEHHLVPQTMVLLEVAADHD